MKRARESAPGVRIGSGTLRGRRLTVGADTRPTGGRVREALIDRWRSRLTGARVLDLFAGSGAVGLHAISCGAESLVSVERSRRTADRIRAAAAEWSLGDRVRVVDRDAVDFLRRERTRFDLIFADPPYDFDAYDELASAALERLAEGGELAIEHRAGYAWEPDEAASGPIGSRPYGESALSFFHAASGRGAA